MMIWHFRVGLFAAFVVALLPSLNSISEARMPRMSITPPPGTMKTFSRTESNVETQALKAMVQSYLHGKHNILSERYYRIDPRAPWIQIRKHVAGQRYRGEKRAPGSTTKTRPSWHKFSDTVDLYPENPPFAVAQLPGATGGKAYVVGYFELIAAPK